MMRFTQKYLLYTAVFAWMHFPSNAFAAACSFPLTQTAAQSCDGLFVSAGQTGAVLNAGTINQNLWTIRNLGTISDLTNSLSGIINGTINGTALENTHSGTITLINNSGLIEGHAGIINDSSSVINSINNSGNINVGQEAIGNGGAINSIINSGNMYANTAGVAVMAIWNSTDSTITNIDNISGGVISGYYGIENRGTITTLTNSAGATINSVNSSGIGVYNECGIIDNLINSGTIANGINNNYMGFGGNPLPIVYLYRQINSLTNNVSGTITNAGNAIYNADKSTIGAIINVGTINSTGANGIQNLGTITSINNSGIISGAGYSINNVGQIITGITNTGTISSLANSQGGASPQTVLSYTGNLPTNYNLIINSTTHYGQLSVTAPAGPMAFGIDGTSSVTAGTTYTDILQGFSSLAGITGTTGNFASLPYSIVADPTHAGYWNLVFSDNSNVQPGTTTDASNITGNPTLSGGTLDMNQANTTYSNNFTVSNTASTINQSGNISTFDGVFSNVAGQTGNLVISNSGNGGAVVFNAANTYTGTTEVSNGAKLVVNGSITSATTVDAGGTLSGTGSVGSVTVADGGILAPGSFGSVGRMTINGNLVLDADPAITNITVSGTSSSQINVSGTASLGGALNVSGSYPAAAYLPRTKYTILTATGGISGTYGSLNTGINYTFPTPTLYYGSNDVTLGFALTPFSTVAKNVNQRNIGNALTIAALGPVNSLGAP